jgi:predicted TIM-barrel fold metal-dependent hydrolase
MKSVPTIDAHHHIWRLNDLPWLSGSELPRIFGPYKPICRDYPIDEFRSDTAGCDIAKSVYVQTNWPGGKATTRRDGFNRFRMLPVGHTAMSPMQIWPIQMSAH